MGVRESQVCGSQEQEQVRPPSNCGCRFSAARAAAAAVRGRRCHRTAACLSVAVVGQESCSQGHNCFAPRRRQRVQPPPVRAQNHL
jgi:hypothetical protein